MRPHIKKTLRRSDIPTPGTGDPTTRSPIPPMTKEKGTKLVGFERLSSDTNSGSLLGVVRRSADTSSGRSKDSSSIRKVLDADVALTFPVTTVVGCRRGTFFEPHHSASMVLLDTACPVRWHDAPHPFNFLDSHDRHTILLCGIISRITPHQRHGNNISRVEF